MMLSIIKKLVRLQLVICLFTSTVAGIAAFTNPSSGSALTLTIGQPYNVEWENAGNDYSEMSLGLLADATGNDLWLLSNQIGYTAQNYQWSAVTFGNSGILLSQGPFRFILVNGTSFGEEALSTTFRIIDNSSMTTTSNSPTATATAKSTVITTTPTAASSSVASSSRLSTSAKAGIGVGVPAVAILASCALFFVFRHHRRANQKQNVSIPHQLTYDKPELSGVPKIQVDLGGVIEHNGVHEVSGENYVRVHEAP